MPGGVSYIGDLSIGESGGEITSQSVGDKALMSTAADATSIEVSSSTGKLGLVDRGSSLANGVQRDQVSKSAGAWLRGPLTATSSAGGVFSVKNSYGSNLVVTRVIIYITALVGSASNLNVGIGDDGSTSYKTLIDGLSANGATGAYDNIKNKGSNGEECELWGTNKYITASLDGESGSFAGFYAIHVIDLNS